MQQCSTSENDVYGFPMWRSVDLVQASKNDSGTWLDFTTGGNDMLTNTISLQYKRKQGLDWGF